MIVLRQKFVLSGLPIARIQASKTDIEASIATGLGVAASRVNITGVAVGSRRQLFARLLSTTTEIQYEVRFRDDEPETATQLSLVMSKMADMGDGKLTSQTVIEEIAKRLDGVTAGDMGMSSSPPEKQVLDIPSGGDGADGDDSGGLPPLLEKNVGGVYAACVLAVALLAVATVYGVQTYREL